MRWWLALTFGAIAALTALAVATLAEQRSEDAVRARARTLAVGNTVQAAIDVGAAGRSGRANLLDRISDERRIALYLLDESGRLLSSSRSHGAQFESVPFRDRAVATAIAGRRFVETNAAVRSTTVGVRLGGNEPGIVLGYARHPDLAAGLGIFRRESLVAAVWATVIAAAVGLLVAVLMARRVRRIADAAAAIEAGDFDVRLEPGLPDEVGELAMTIDRMRSRLRASFRALESEHDRLRHVVGRLREAVVAVDSGLRVEFANPAAATVLGVREGYRLTEPWQEFALGRFVERLFESGAAPAEARVLAEDDRSFVVTGVPARDRDDTAVIVVVDLSESERQERVQRQFVANAAHELRTPLSGILSTVEVLREGAMADPAVADEFLANIEGEADRLARLTRALLVLARAEAHQEAPPTDRVQLGSMLERVGSVAHLRPGVELHVDCEPDLSVVGDADLLEQAVSNVLDNAAAHTTVGRIELRAHESAAGQVVVEVADTGDGISPDEQGRIFDRFYRARTKTGEGFGLGLPISRQAVRVLGGRITVDSTVGAGTTVRLVLPRKAERQ
jgi:two-component system phosphate regulon sensor histidine kinase PhoR